VSEQCFTSPPTQYRLYGRQFYRSKDPTRPKDPIATRRLISQIILESVVNASSRRRRGLVPCTGARHMIGIQRTQCFIFWQIWLGSVQYLQKLWCKNLPIIHCHDKYNRSASQANYWWYWQKNKKKLHLFFTAW